MAKDLKNNNLDTIIVQVPRKLKLDFQKTCRDNEMSMSRGIRLFIRSATKGKFIFSDGIKVKRKRA